MATASFDCVPPRSHSLVQPLQALSVRSPRCADRIVSHSHWGRSRRSLQTHSPSRILPPPLNSTPLAFRARRISRMSVKCERGFPSFPPGLKQRTFFSNMPWNIPISMSPFFITSQFLLEESADSATTELFVEALRGLQILESQTDRKRSEFYVSQSKDM